MWFSSASGHQMKPIHLVPPSVALVIAAAWLGGQRGSITTLERENTRLRHGIASVRAAEATAGNSSGTAADNNKPGDWKKFAGDLGDMGLPGQMPDMRAIVRLQQRILEMNEAELIAALDGIATLDLPEASRQALEGMLIGAIAGKNPELALNRFVGKMHEEGANVSWHLSRAFETWLGSDPTAAGAWFDSQIAAGVFDSKSLDGRSLPRIHFEGAIIKSLLSSDPDAAARRLAEIPPDQRRDVFRFSVHHVDESDQKNFAQLVRSSLPEDQQLETIARQVNRYANAGDLTKINDYIARIEATPEERAACVEHAAEQFNRNSLQQITREDFDRFRTWAGSTDPGTADLATGKALASALWRQNALPFSEIAAIAADYHAAGAADDVLIPLLEHGRARSSQDEARELAMRISDEPRRAEILKNFQ